MKDLLESGVHFGHQAKRWDPRMASYIYTERNGIHIIDLQKTVEKGEIAYNFVKDKVAEGSKVLFVGTKKQAQEAVQLEAERCGHYFITQRWLGGMLTNFSTIKRSILRLKKLEKMEVDGTFESLTKKERLNLKKEKGKLEKVLGGIKEMGSLPDVLFIIDPDKEKIAVSEARKMNIPIVAIVDSNCNPQVIDYPIPGNDDAIRAIGLFMKIISDAVIEGETISGKAMAGARSEELRSKDNDSNLEYEDSATKKIASKYNDLDYEDGLTHNISIIEEKSDKDIEGKSGGKIASGEVIEKEYSADVTTETKKKVKKNVTDKDKAGKE